jgi:hypothetical protein
MIPQMIIDHFEVMHINITFNELHSRFGFTKKEWEKRFKDFISSQPGNASELDAFIKFGNRFFNPVLNEILCRNSVHPTFVQMLLYIIEKNSVPKSRPPVSDGSKGKRG